MNLEYQLCLSLSKQSNLFSFECQCSLIWWEILVFISSVHVVKKRCRVYILLTEFVCNFNICHIFTILVSSETITYVILPPRHPRIYYTNYYLNHSAEFRCIVKSALSITHESSLPIQTYRTIRLDTSITVSHSQQYTVNMAALAQ